MEIINKKEFEIIMSSLKGKIDNIRLTENEREEIRMDIFNIEDVFNQLYEKIENEKGNM